MIPYLKLQKLFKSRAVSGLFAFCCLINIKQTNSSRNIRMWFLVLFVFWTETPEVYILTDDRTTTLIWNSCVYPSTETNISWVFYTFFVFFPTNHIIRCQI